MTSTTLSQVLTGHTETYRGFAKRMLGISGSGSDNGSCRIGEQCSQQGRLTVPKRAAYGC